MLSLTLRLLVDERKLLDIGQRFDILGRNTRFVEGTLVVHRVLVRVLHHGLQTLELHRLELGARHALDLGVVIFLIVR